jgi:hypothetical protein
MTETDTLESRQRTAGTAQPRTLALPRIRARARPGNRRSQRTTSRRLATRDRRPCRFRIRGEAAARRLFLPFDGMEQRPLRLEQSGRPRVLPRCAGVVGDCSYATVVRSSSRNHSAGRSYRPWLSEGPSASNAAPVMHWWVNDGRSFSGTSPLGRKIGPGRAEVRMLAGTTLSTFRAKRERACPRGRTPRSSVATDGTAAGDTPGSGMFGHG